MHKFLHESLADCDVNAIDLNLSDDAKTRIRVIKPDARFALAEWKRDSPGRNKTPEYKKVFLSKTFIPDVFPGYEGSVWIVSGRTTGTSFAFQAHPSYRSPQKARKLKLEDSTQSETYN